MVPKFSNVVPPVSDLNGVGSTGSATKRRSDPYGIVNVPPPDIAPLLI